MQPDEKQQYAPPATAPSLSVLTASTAWADPSANKVGCESLLKLQLSSPIFEIAWISIVALHIMCGTVSILSGRIYAFAASPGMIYWAEVVGGTSNPYFLISSIVFTLIGAVHLLQALWFVLISIHSKKLVFAPSMQLIRSSRSHRSWVSPRVYTTKACRHAFVIKIKRMAKAVARWWLKIIGFLGVESKYFPYLFVAREIIEVTSQTYQANRSCNLVPRLWINHFMMSLLIINCWSTPILQLVFHRRPAAERVTCVMVDAILNISASLIAPITVFLPYYKEFDVPTLSFPDELQYDTLWITRFMMESRVIFILSMSDLVSKIINHASIYSSVSATASLIQRRSLRVHVTHMTNILPKNVVPSNSYLARGKQALHALFVIWVFCLIGIYARAVHRGSQIIIGCQVTTTSWFATKYPCSFFTVNCHRHQMTSPNGTELDKLDKDTLVDLVYAHCPDLQIPTEIQNFPNLISIEIYNCTIRSWPRESAISPNKHPKMLSITIARTNMTEFPQGLLGPLPSTLTDVEFSFTNLTNLPDDIGERWHALSSLYVEFSELSEVPASIFQLPIIFLSLAGNNIQYLPPLDHVSGIYYDLDLSRNPLQALPATIGADMFVASLNLEYSNVSNLPPWMYSSLGTLYGKGSPFCETVNTSSEIGCTASDPRGENRVSINLIDSMISLDLERHEYK